MAVSAYSCWMSVDQTYRWSDSGFDWAPWLQSTYISVLSFRFGRNGCHCEEAYERRLLGKWSLQSIFCWLVMAVLFSNFWAGSRDGWFLAKSNVVAWLFGSDCWSGLHSCLRRFENTERIARFWTSENNKSQLPRRANWSAPSAEGAHA